MSNDYRLITDERMTQIYESTLSLCATDPDAYHMVCNPASMPSPKDRANFHSDVETWRRNHPEENR